jgi:outer membrane protein OmpA-like peptidoglycan-associated protein
VIQLLNDNPNIEIEISGHTDNLGSTSYNQDLSKKRAEQVFNALVAGNVDKRRLNFIGFGDQKPIANNDTEDGRKSNRRIEFRVLRIMP